VLALVAGGVLAAGAKAPDFTLVNQDGKEVGLKDSAGKIVVLHWINWGCPVDMRHHKAGTVNKLVEKYKDVVFLGINSTKSASVAANKKGVAANSLKYDVLDDHPGTTGKAYGAKCTPDMRIIAKDGTIAYEGAIDDDPRGNKGDDAVNYVDKALAELIAGKAVSTPKTRPYGCSVKYAN
jgi:peroxiredoxin